MAKLNFDATNVDPSKAYEVLPEGKYLAAIKGSEDEEDQERQRRDAGVHLDRIGRAAQGRIAVAAAQHRQPEQDRRQDRRGRTVGGVHATGVMRPRDTVQLHDLPCTLIVKCKKREDNGELTNEIKGVEHKSRVHESRHAGRAGRRRRRRRSAARLDAELMADG
jgi:hypothetical protein